MLTIAVVIALIGLLDYGVTNNPKAAEIGRIMFFTGLLVTLLRIGSQTILR